MTMLTTNYEEWREREAARLCLENPEVECPVCERSAGICL